MQFLMMFLFCIEILFLATIFALYVYKQYRKVRYEKENRKLAIDQIMQTFRLVCIDNDKLYEAVCELRQENAELKEICKNK